MASDIKRGMAKYIISEESVLEETTDLYNKVRFKDTEVLRQRIYSKNNTQPFYTLPTHLCTIYSGFQEKILSWNVLSPRIQNLVGRIVELILKVTKGSNERRKLSKRKNNFAVGIRGIIVSV